MSPPSSSSSPKKEESEGKKKVEDGTVKRSISIRFVRHAESRNNEIYREARHIYRGGTPDFDLDGWNSYVDEHRLADPGLSARGSDQARALAEGYLVEHLANQASRPVKFVVSPMRRTLDTVLPALRGLEEEEAKATVTATNGEGDSGRQRQQQRGGKKSCCEVIVNALFHESEGCHIREKPEPGMNQAEITDLLSQQASLSSEPTFVGFPADGDGDDEDPRLKGWYANGTGSETRPESEHRAAKFHLWMCEFLDAELTSAAPAEPPPDEGEHEQRQRQGRRRHEPEERGRDHDDDHHPHHHDVFDAGVTVPGEEHEVEHDWSAPRRRRRRTAVFVGHGDFMGLVLKRIVAGFGYAIGSAFVHFNTGITDLEYFGKGRFLVMSVNQTPHLNRLPPVEAHRLKTGGGLKDGWSYLVPNERHLLYEEVSVAFSDELEDHVREQTEALKDLYLRKGSARGTAAAMTTVPRTESGGVGCGSGGVTDTSSMKSVFLSRRRSSFDTLGSRRHTEDNFTFEELSVDKSALGVSERVGYEVTFVVRRGMQVVGCASVQEESGLLTDIVVRPSARRTKVGTALVDAMKTHLKKAGKSNNTILVRPTCQESREFFEAVGFQAVKDDAHASDGLSLKGEQFYRVFFYKMRHLSRHVDGKGHMWKCLVELPHKLFCIFSMKSGGGALVNCCQAVCTKGQVHEM